MEFIEFLNEHQARFQAEKSEIQDYLENMSLIQQKILEYWGALPDKPFSKYLLKKDIETDSFILKNAWCYNLRVLDDNDQYEVDFNFDSKETK
jgi:hypothetical protein